MTSSFAVFEAAIQVKSMCWLP